MGSGPEHATHPSVAAMKSQLESHERVQGLRKDVCTRVEGYGVKEGQKWSVGRYGRRPNLRGKWFGGVTLGKREVGNLEEGWES